MTKADEWITGLDVKVKKELDPTDMFGDKPEGKKQASNEDIELAELGITSEYNPGFHRKYPGKKIFFNGKLTKGYFKWYLEVCNNQQLISINSKLLTEEFQELLAKKRNTGVKEFQDDDKSLVTQYIEKNAELIKENEKMKKYKDFTRFLYDFMGEAIDKEYKISDEEYQCIKEIKEVIE